MLFNTHLQIKIFLTHASIYAHVDFYKGKKSK